MTPESHRTNPRSPTARPNGRKLAARAGSIEGPEDLAALSAASRAFARGQDENGRSLPGSGWVIAILAAAAVGALTAFSLPNQYICAATFRFHTEPTMAYRAEIRKELLDFVWNDQASVSVGQAPRKKWFVDAPGNDLLRFCLQARDPAVGLGHAHRLATSFCAMTKRRAENLRSSPGEGERALSSQVATLESQLRETRQALEKAVALKSDDDPRAKRTTLLDEWEHARKKFERSREALAAVTSRVEFLRHENKPPNAIVSSEDRRRALVEDEALQQDLGELTVNLTEGKLELLKAWQHASSSLDQLETATQELTALDPASLQADENTGPLVERLRTAADEYQTRLTAFATDWKGEFDALKRRPVDPMTAEQLEVYRRVRTRLGDFLFQAGNRLAAIRRVVDGIEDLGSGGARYYVLHATLQRRFRAMQTAHYRFEFAAGTIESRRNFQLDAALRSARGLFRRTQSRIAHIDRRLMEKAQREALARRDAELAELDSKIRSLRESANEAVERLIGIQEDLQVSAGLTEAHLLASLRAGMSEDWIGVTESQLTAARDALEKLEKTRLNAAASTGIALESVDIIGRTVTPTDRLQVGGMSALAALLIVGAAQIWMRKRAIRAESS